MLRRRAQRLAVAEQEVTIRSQERGSGWSARSKRREERRRSTEKARAGGAGARAGVEFAAYSLASSVVGELRLVHSGSVQGREHDVGSRAVALGEGASRQAGGGTSVASGAATPLLIPAFQWATLGRLSGCRSWHCGAGGWRLCWWRRVAPNANQGASASASARGGGSGAGGHACKSGRARRRRSGRGPCRRARFRRCWPDAAWPSTWARAWRGHRRRPARRRCPAAAAEPAAAPARGPAMLAGRA